MSKIILAVCVLCLLSLAYGAFATSTDKVNIDVAGMINHGPMQPTVKAIKEVTSKYGDTVTVNWIDTTTDEGQKYLQDHGLSAHLNILINGNYKFNLDGKDVTFQWLVNGTWTKDNLDAVISDTIDNNGKAVPVNV
jgi:hypothetical protein